MDTLPQKPARKPRTTKPKITEAIITTAAAKDTTNIKTNTKDNTLKNTTENFKTQKKKETANIKQQIKDHAALTKQVHILNKSIAKLAKHK